MTALRTLLLLLAALAAPASAVVRQAEADAEDGWIPLDGVQTIINDEVVTESELAREANSIRESGDFTISTLEELREFESQVRNRVVMRRLQSQAGRALGMPEEEVDRLVSSHLDGVRKRLGLMTFLADLEERGLAADEIQADTRRQFYGQTWVDDMIGRANAGGRPRRDRYVRPGEMHHIYLGVREQFGAPEQVELVQFTMTGAEGVGPVDALAEARTIRDRAAAGEDPSALAREIGPQRSAARSFTVPIRNITLEELREFAESALPGAVSPLRSDRNEEFDRLEHTFFQLVGRQEAVAPRPFLDGEVQELLSERVLEQRDQWFLARGHQELVEGSYIEPPLRLAPAP